MAGKPQSWKKVRDERRKENFVGRGEPIRIFTENLESDTPDYMVISITGEGGVGKSTLLARFANIATSPEYNAAVVICDDKQTSPVLAMGHIAKKLAEKGISHKEFDERYRKYGEIRQELESDPKVPRGGVNLLAMGITDLTIKSLRKTPGLGVFFEYADEKAAGESLAELMQYSISKWGNKDEVKLLREPEQVLTPLFIELIKKAYDDNKIVLMFDVFERTSDALATWLLMLFNFEYGEFDTHILFVVSGRESLEQHWTELAGLVCHNSLEPFNLDELRLYLSNHEITDDELVNQIYEDTNGLPVLVELLAAAKPKPRNPLPDVSKDAVERFLQWTPQEERRKAALYAAIPRQFNKDIISASLGQDASTLFNWLSAQSYIRTDSEKGWFFHEKVRELMVRYLRHTEPKQLEDIHRKLTERFQTEQANLNLQIKEAYESDYWQKLEIERIYHLIAYEPEKSLSVITNAFLHALRWRSQFCEQIAQICIQIGNETQLEKVISHGQELLNTHNVFQKNEHEELIRKLGKFIRQKSLTVTTTSICYAKRARAKRYLGKYKEAIKDYEKAIELDPEYSGVFSGLGETYRLMGMFEEAIKNFDIGIAYDLNDTWSLSCRALSNQALGRLDEMLNDVNAIIEINPEDYWAFAERAWFYSSRNRYDEALADLNTAIDLNPNYTWAITSRGKIYRLLKQYETALKDLDLAIRLNENYSWAIAQRGETYRLLKKYEEALSDFSVAIELDRNIVWYWNNRAITYRSLKKYPEAIIDFNKAIELDSKYALAFANRGETYRLLKKFEESLLDFEKAIELDSSTAWYWGGKAATLLSLYKYKDALEILSKAVEIDPKYATGFAYRSLIFFRMKKLDKAIADLTAAIEIDPKYTWAIVERGIVYRSMRKYKEALEDFERSIDLDKKCARAFVERGVFHRNIGEFNHALEDINFAIEIDATYVDGLIERGITHRIMGEYDAALVDFNRAVSIEPQNTRAIAQKGRFYQFIGKFQEALEALDKAIEIDKNYTWAIAQRGRTFEAMGKYEDAIENLDIAININPTDAWVFSARSRIRCKFNDYSGALDDINESIVLDSLDHYSFVRRASILLKSGNIEQAQKDIQLVLSREPIELWDYYNIAISLFMSNKIADAISMLGMAFRNDDCKTFSIVDDLLDSVRDLREFKTLIG